TGAYDVAEPASARAIVALARDAFGRIDVLVNNAGHVAVGPLSQQSDAELRAQFGTHVIGPVALVREALPLLRASHGHVFMVGSGVARVPVPGLGAYPPSKAATRSAASILRGELKRDGIVVTYVDPGVVDTAFMSRAGMPGAPQAIMATPEDVARKILLAVGTRRRVVNAVPWQTAFVALSELFPRVTDFIIERNPALVGIQDAAQEQSALADPPTPALTTGVPPEPAAPAGPASSTTNVQRLADAANAAGGDRNAYAGAENAAGGDLNAYASSDEGEAALHPGDTATFDDAIEPVRRRMERVKLREEFVRGLLREGEALDAHEVALQWAGMPNKNERAATNEVLDALATAGFLERDGERYRVLRGPD
ncbi:MAG: Short-chain dehydrogenase/reductase, partial [Candidatus Eremiobacteraeota bacterium]|nr:Short-chain dehydrogenase/reductase [Candidatus Eremiobacteraeota bacterium]